MKLTKKIWNVKKATKTEQNDDVESKSDDGRREQQFDESKFCDLGFGCWLGKQRWRRIVWCKFWA